MSRTIQVTIELEDEFLSDIIVTAVEGGIGYWSQTEQYQYVDCDNEDGHDPLHVVVGEPRSTHTYNPNCYQTRATIIDAVATAELEPSGCFEVKYDITLDKIAEAIQKIAQWEAEGLGWKQTMDAVRIGDAGMIDAGDADNIVQVACFGDVVYA